MPGNPDDGYSFTSTSTASNNSCDSGCNQTSGSPTSGDPVYIKEGEFAHSVTDISIPGRGYSINITRNYRSRRHIYSPIGYGWAFNYDIKAIRVYQSGVLNYIYLKDGTSTNRRYKKDDTNPNKFVRSQEPLSYFLRNTQTNILTLYKEHNEKYVFDGNDNISRMEDWSGNKLNFEYGAGQIIKITDDANHYVTLSYNSGRVIEKITDFTGRTWEYQYDSSASSLLYVTGPNTPEYPNGLTTSYWYTDSNLVEIYDTNNNLAVQNHYSIDDKVVQQDIGEGSYFFDYNDSQNKTTTITDREGVRTEMVYDGGTGQLASQTVYTKDTGATPNSFTTSYYYDPISFFTPNIRKRTRIVYPGGDSEYFTYNWMAKVTGKYYKTGVDEPNDPCDPNVTAILYTYNGSEVNSIRDPMGNVTYYDYNSTTGKVDQIRHPDGTSEKFAYNTYGQIMSRAAADNIVTEYVYYSDANDSNNFSRLWKIIEDSNTADGCNITTQYKYDALGRIIEVKDPNGDTTKSKFNNLNQLIESITPSPYNYVTKLSYDTKGNRSKIEREIGGENEPNQIMSYLYNERNKLAEITDPLNYVTKYGYNKNDEPNSVIDAEDNNTLTEYNERGLVVKVTDANGGITRFGYTVNSKLNDINDPNGNITRFEYDGFNRVVRIIYPDDSNEQFIYDKNGNVTSKTTRKGDTISYEYDSMNRMITKTRPNEPNTIFSYDIAGRIAEVNDHRGVDEGGGVTKFKYDRVGRIIEVNDIYGRTVKYEYDNKGQRTKLLYPVNYYEQGADCDARYSYDTLGRVTEIGKGEYGLIARYEYDQLGRRTAVKYGNNTACYEYDLGNRLVRLTNSLTGGTTFDFNYADYDKVGNRLSCKEGAANKKIYDYDNLYQLTAVDYNDGNMTDYSYDILGNRTSVINGGTTSYTSNSLNQYESVAGTNYSYDKNGNLTFDGVYHYYYDCENRLTEVNDINNQRTATYKYDFKGRRVAKAVGATTTTFVYDGDQIIQEYRNGYRWKTYYYGTGIDELIRMIGDNLGEPGLTYYYDGLGSVIALADYMGNVLEKYSYDVFGKPTIRNSQGAIRTTSAVGNRYMFTGREFEPETGLYYYRARYYHPVLGRFMQTDPIRYKAGSNYYAYVKNRPTFFVDPFGKRWGIGGPVGPPPGSFYPPPGTPMPGPDDQPGWIGKYPSLGACIGAHLSPLCGSVYDLPVGAGLVIGACKYPLLGTIGEVWALYCGAEFAFAAMLCTDGDP